MEEVCDYSTFAMHNNFHSPSLPGLKKTLSPLNTRKKASYDEAKGTNLLESGSELGSGLDSGPSPQTSKLLKSCNRKEN